jgi:hypothetical protein
VSYSLFLIYSSCYAHILYISICLHIHLYVEYNHSDMNGMICTQHPKFSPFNFPLRSYQARHYLS